MHSLTRHDLVPDIPASTSQKEVFFRVPLTPFFLDASDSTQLRVLGLMGDSFFLQNKSSRMVAVDGAVSDDPICGFAAYRTSTSVDTAGTGWSGSEARTITFDRDQKEVRIDSAVTGTHAIGFTHSRTATTSFQGNRFIPQHVAITLTDDVDRDWLHDELKRWMEEPEDFREATGTGIATYAYLGHAATCSEGDGYLAILSYGDAVVHGPWFQGTPLGMSGDEGTKWNGQFSSHVRKVRRKNAPVLHRESSSHNGQTTAGVPNVAVAEAIYREGHAELELSDLLNELWVDDFGVFRQQDALDSCPLTAADTTTFKSILPCTGDGAANELMVLSVTGSVYRVTIQSGDIQHDDNDGTWHTTQTHVLVTDEKSKQATLRVEGNETGSDMRVSRLELRIGTGEDIAWRVLADVETYQTYLQKYREWQTAWTAWDAGGRQGDEPMKPKPVVDPNRLIGPELDGRRLLLATVQARKGSRFGFEPFTHTDQTAKDRYRKRTFRLDLTPGTYEPHDGGCGLGSLTGRAELEWSEEYSLTTGEILPRTITNWKLTINDEEWTRTDQRGFDNIAFPGASESARTATLLRYEGTNTWAGRFLVKLDSPDPVGRIIESSWVKTDVKIKDGKNLGDAIAFDLPDPGQTVFCEGQRLTYDRPS